MGEDAIDEEGVDNDQDEGEGAGDAEGVGDWDALVDGVGVLQGVVLEGKVLVVGFEGVEDGEADHAGTGWVSGSMGGGGGGGGSDVHENDIVEDITGELVSVCRLSMEKRREEGNLN